MRMLIIALALALAGCGRAAALPGIEVRTVTRTVEVQRPCAATRPARPTPLARPLPADLGQLAALLGAKLAEYAGAGGYADRADAAIELCTRP